MISGTPAAASPPVGEPCVYREMRTVEGGETTVSAVDRSGRYQVGGTGRWGSPDVLKARVVLWRDGTPHVGPEVDPYGGFAAVSTTGVAVGWAHDGNWQRHAVMYAYGQIIKLATPAGATQAVASAVDANGTVAGTAYGEPDIQRAVAWSPDGEVRVLATPPGFSHASATHIDTDGTVLGYAASGSSMPDRVRLVVWALDGTPRVLPVAGAADPEPRMWPLDFRDGIVYGEHGGAFVRWDLEQETATVIDTEGGSLMFANSRGSMVSFGGFGLNETVFVGGGVVRRLHNGNVGVSPLGLTDTDLVFGRTLAYMDCR